MESIPSRLKNLRACLLCGRIKTMEQFLGDGCDTVLCEQFLMMRDEEERVYECTTPNYDGMIALTSPSDSWVAKWQGTDKFSPGIFAVAVSGQLPNTIEQHLTSNGIRARPRQWSNKN